MNRKLILGLGVALVSASALAQVGAPPSSSPPANPPSGTQPATPATPGGAGTPATPATPADPGAKGSLSGSGNTPAGSVTGSATFSTIDKNADGKITRAEARGDASLNAKFKDLDSNKDGTLSMSEYATFGASVTTP